MSESPTWVRMIPCCFCGKPADPDGPTVWRQIVAFERKGYGSTRRGGSDIALRAPGSPLTVAHELCVRRQQKGVAATQGSLLGGEVA